MFKCLLVISLALIPYCSTKPTKPEEEGPCTKLPKTVPSTTFRGKAYTWAYNFFGGLVIDNPGKCVADDFDEALTWSLNTTAVQILGTDNKNYIVIYICAEHYDTHSHHTVVFTLNKSPTKAVLKAIAKAHIYNGLTLKTLVRSCK